MRRTLLLIAGIACWSVVTAQSVTNYSFTASAGSYTPLTGGYCLPFNGGAADEGYINSIPLGFSFVYMGTVCTFASASTNGWMTLGQTITSSSSTNSLSTGGNRPVLAPLWDNLDLQTVSNFSYQTAGTAPFRVFTAEWKNMQWNNAASGNTISFQVKLYETTGVIEFVYRQESGSLSGPGASIGITASMTGSGNFLSLNNAGASPTVSSATETTNINAKPATGQVYAFTPPAPPDAPSSLLFSSVGQSGMTLDWTDNSSNETGFAVFRSTDGISYSCVYTTAAGVTTYAATGLLPGLTYYWQVYAINEGRMSAALPGSQSTASAGTIISVASGNWSDPATWSTAAVPTVSDNVTIADGHSVVIDAAATCNSLTVGQGTSGILRFGTTAVTMNVINGVNVATGAVFDAGEPAGPSLLHSLYIGGNYANSPGTGNLNVDGTFDMYIAAANGKAYVYFAGIPDAAFTGNGTVCDFYSNTLIKGSVGTWPGGTLPPVLEILRDFTVLGSSTSGFLSSHGSGILKIGGSFTQSNPVYTIAAFTIPATGGLWLNNPNFTITAISGTTGPTINGLLKISSGTMNTGTAASCYMQPGIGGSFYLEGGSLNISGRFGHNTNVFNFKMSGGIFKVGTISGYSNASYHLADFRGCASFGMSGGTIEVQSLNANISGYEWGGPAGVVDITGGTVQFGNASSGSSPLTFTMLNNAPNVVLDNTSANHGITMMGNTTVNGNLTMNGSGTFSFGTTTFALTMNGCSVSSPGNIINNGTFTMNAGTANALLFTGSFGNQTFTNNGTITGNEVPSLTVGNTFSGSTVTLPDGLTLRGGASAVTPALTLSAGTLVANSLTLMTGTTGFSCTRTNGYLQNTPAFSFSTTPVNYTYNGTSAQVTGPELPADISGTLTINNPSGVTLNAALSAGKLTMTAGTLITTETNLLTLTGTAATDVTYTSGQISGPFARTLPASYSTAGAYLFPLGKSAYRPLELVNPVTNSGGTVVIRAEVFDSDCGGTPGASMVSLNSDRYWTAVISSGTGNFTSTQLRLTETGLTNNHGIAKSATQTGIYELASLAGPSGNTLITDVMTSLSWYAIGIKKMNYVSSTATQTVTSYVRQESADNQILGLQVVTSGSNDPITLSAYTLNTSGSTNAADITAARIYYTGTSSAFAATNQFGSTYVNPSGSFTITGTQALAEGTNYFWLTYDISVNAGNNDLVDGEFNAVTVGGNSFTPTLQAPTGSRPVKAALEGTVTIGTGGSYATLTATGGLFEYINQAGLRGNTTIQVLSDISTETGANALSQWTEVGGSNYTLTIQPDAATLRTISGTYTGALVRLSGADRVTIDGRYAGSGTYLSFRNLSSNTSTYLCPLLISSLGAGAGACDNTIRNSYFSCNHNGSNTSGISVCGTTPGNSYGDDNDNVTIRECEISKAYYGIFVRGNTTGYDNNLNIIGNRIGSDVAGDYITRAGLYIWYADGATISENEVFNVISSSGVPVGLYLYTGFINSTVTKNRVHGIIYAGTSNSGGTGIMIAPGNNLTSNNALYNNLIYDISGTGSNSSGTYINGISVGGPNGFPGQIRLYYNSVHLNGSISRAAATQDKSMAIYIYSGCQDITLNNNIFSNTIENTTGTAKAYAIYSGITSAAYDLINNNVYFAGGPEGVLGYLSYDRTSLAEWRAVTGQDGASVNADPLYATATNLHCDFFSPVFLGGSPVTGITTDFEEVTRHAATPTIGAYETGLDARGPQFSYTPLTNTSITGDRTLAVTMIDYTGVPTSGTGLPVLYWRINQGAWNGTAATYVSPGQYTFTFGSGVVTSDSVYYYFVAQDLAVLPNISASPSAGASGFFTDPPGCTTPPTTPHSYRISVGLNGNINVGAGETYTNLTGSAGLFRMINENVITGNLTVTVTSDLVEDGVYALSQWYEEGGSNFSVTIRPDGTTERLIAGDIAQGMIRLDGADRFSIDGRNGGSGRYLRFRNTNTAGKTFSFVNDACSDTIRNCIIEGSSLGTSNAVIHFGSTTGTSGNDNNAIMNNMIRDRSDAAGVPYEMIFSAGSVTTYARSNSNNLISGNEIFNFGSYGINLSSGNATGWVIADNHFYNNLAAPPASSQYAVCLNTGIYPHTHVVTGNYIGGQAPFCGGNAWENTATGTFCGIYINADWDDPSSIQGNTITNINMSNTSAGNFYGIWIYDGEANIGTATGNTIGSTDTSRNIRNNSGISNRVYGIFLSSDNYNSRIENNEIRNLLLTGSGTSGYPELAGIYIYSADCRKNIITGLGTSQASLEPYIYGIYNSGLSGASNEFSNNVIALDGGETNNPEIAGFYEYTYSNCSHTIYYNSIIISGKATPWMTYAYYQGSGASCDMKNNTFINTRENDGSDNNYAVYFSDYGVITSDYNDLWCPHGNLGYYTYVFLTLPDWKEGTGLDAHSIGGDPVFADPKDDLRPDLSSPLLGAGTPLVDVDTDIEGNPRSLTAPSIGAYENGGDYRGPVISLTPLKNTTSTSTRTLVATITDDTGVPVSGSGLPMLYWRINLGSWTPLQATPLGGGQYQFSFGSGVVLGDSVSYYLVAQDLQATPLFTASPSEGADGFTADPPACATQPSSPYIYWIGNAIGGIIPVGTTETCFNLTGNTGLFRLINHNVLSGDIIAAITTDLTEEGIHALNNWAEEGTGGYTLTIKPAASVTPSVTGNAAEGLIRFNGADRVVIDGSNNGTVTRDLTITNTNTVSNPYTLHFGSVGSLTFHDIVVKNCILAGDDNTSATGGACLVVSGITSSSDTGFFDNITVQNNEFRKSKFGVYFRGGFGLARGFDVTVQDNILTAGGPEAIGYIGIYLQGVDGGVISGNEIANLEQAIWTGDRGIWVAEGCSDIDVHSNYIHDLGYSGTMSGNAAHGILVTTVKANAGIDVYNNLIEHITGDGVDYSSAGGLTQNPAGITAYAQQSGINIRFNTIYLYGNTLDNYQALSAGILIGQNSVVDLQDNIIVNTLGLAGSTGFGACAVFAQISASQLDTCDYNDYYVSITGSGTAVIGLTDLASFPTLPDWQAATGEDTHSLNADPLFVSSSDLHPQEPALDGAGVPIPGITTDYDGMVRGTPPDMGAYEFSLSGVKTWDGSVSTAWNDGENWTPAGVPVATDNVIVPAGTPNSCIVNAAGLTCKDIILYTGATVTVDAAAVIDIRGNLTIQNGAALNNGGYISLEGNLLNENTE